jgi:ATP adenylyltransferase
MSGCRLCFDLMRQDSKEPWNKPLFESPNFVVLPSLGALVEGWLLLIPKSHFICLGALPEVLVAEMHEMKEIISKFLQTQYGEVCAFEHGHSKPNCDIGCSVDHAHLHIVPIAFDIGVGMNQFLPTNAYWYKADIRDCQTAFARGEDYLYLEQPIGAGRMITSPEIGSQLFRRAIATQLGVADHFNWRENLQLTNVQATIDKLQVHSDTVISCPGRLKAVV